jgi:hypothetical protein
MNEIMNIIKSDWDKILQIFTLLIAIATAFFAYLSIKTTRKISKEQIEYNRELHNQEIIFGRPIISCTGNIGLFNDKIYNLNIVLKNIGKRSLSDLIINYWVLIEEPTNVKIEFQEQYLIANQVDTGFEQIFFERLPRTDSKKKIYYKIRLEYTDVLTNSKYFQDFYYILPTEQQYPIDSRTKEFIGIFAATTVDKDFINRNLK